MKFLFFFFLLLAQHSLTQTFINGSFENNTGPLACNYNLTNAVFNSYMPNVNAYGAGQEVDIVEAGCYIPTIQDGVHAIALAGLVDEVAIELSAPLVPGIGYTLSFWSYGNTSFQTNGSIEVGYSTTNNSFGQFIGVANTVGSTWTNHTFCFTAWESATHITVRNINNGSAHWHQIDNFQIILPDPSFDFNSFCAGGLNGASNIATPGGYFELNPAPLDLATINSVTGELSNTTNGTTYSVQYILPNSTCYPSVSSTELVTVTSLDYTVAVTDAQCTVDDGSIIVTPISGTAPFNFTINGSAPQLSGIFNNLMPNNYEIVITDDAGCEATLNEVVANGSAIDVSDFVVVEPSCAGVCDGSITITPTGGNAPYYYQWYDELNNPIGTNSATITGLCEGNYSVEVTSSGANAIVVYAETFSAGTLGWTLNVPLAPEGADPNFFEIDDDEGGVIAGGCGIAGNGDETLHITSVFFPGGGAAYDAGGLCGILFCPETHRRAESPTISTIGQTGLTLMFEFIAEGDAPNDQATVWYDDGSGWTQLGGNLFSGTGPCAPQGIWTTYSSALPASCENIPNLKIAFRWDNNDDGIGTDPSVAINNLEIIASGPSSCPGTQFMTLVAPQAQDPSFTFDDFCETPNNAPTNIVSPGGTFSFNPAPANGATINPVTGNIINGLPGTYSVEYSFSGSCPTSAIETVTIMALPTPTITGGLQICNGGSTVLDAGAGYAAYFWSTGQTTQTITVTAGIPGIFVDVSDIFGCIGTSPVVDVIEVATIVENSTVTICQGQSAMIHGNIETVAGMYTNTVTTAAGCDSTSNVTLVIDAPPTLDLATIFDESCLGENDGSISINSVFNSSGPLPTEYSWDIFPDPQSAAVTDLAPGFYTVTITNPNNGCFSESVFEIVQGPICCDLVLNSTLTNDPSCAGNDGQITVEATGGDGNYNFSVNGSPFDPNADFTGLSDGSFDITVQDGTLCEAMINVILVPAVGPTINAVNITNLTCFEDGSAEIEIITVGGTGVLSYEITQNANVLTSNTNVFSNLDAGNYLISVTDENNCEVTDNATLTEPAELTVTAQTTDLACDTPNSGIIELNANGNGPFQYSIDGGANFVGTNLFNTLDAGNYSIIVLDAAGCSFSATESLVQPTSPAASFAYSPFVLDVLDSEISLLNNSQNATEYLWEITGSNNYLETYTSFEPDHTFPAEIGTYQICLTASNASSCTSQDCVQIQIGDNSVIYIPNAFTPNDDNNNQYFKPVIRGYDGSNYDMFIFNRWGEMVFESHNLNIGWDGNYDNKPAQDGMYIWKIVVKDVNVDQRQTFTGYLNLIR